MRRPRCHVSALLACVLAALGGGASPAAQDPVAPAPRARADGGAAPAAPTLPAAQAPPTTQAAPTAPAVATPQAPPGGAAPAADVTALRVRVGAQLEHDAQLRFSQDGARAAFDVLRSARGATEAQRAIALVAVGAGRHEDGRELLEAEARYGPGMERLGAIFGLGDLGAPSLELFTALVRDPDESVRGAACLALALGGARQRVAELATQSAPEVADPARAAIEFVRQPLQHVDFKPGVLRLTLRERASAAFGNATPASASAGAASAAGDPAAMNDDLGSNAATAANAQPHVAPDAAPLVGSDTPSAAVATPARTAAAPAPTADDAARATSSTNAVSSAASSGASAVPSAASNTAPNTAPASSSASAPPPPLAAPSEAAPAIPAADPASDTPTTPREPPAAPRAPPPAGKAAPKSSAPSRARDSVVSAAQLGALMEIAVDLDRPALRDHVLESLLDDADPSVAAAAVRVMPEQLVQLLLAKLWRPSNSAQWIALVDAIDRARLERRSLDVLRAALAEPEARDHAAALLLAAGVREARELLSAAPSTQRADRRLWLALGMGRSGDATWVGELSGLALDADPLVRAAAVLGQARLGHGPANERLRERARASGAPAPVASTALDANAIAEVLWRVGSDPAWLTWIQDYHAISSGTQRLQLAVRLVQHGRLSQRESLRTALAQRAKEPLSDELLPELVAALSKEPDMRDLAALEGLAAARSASPATSPIGVRIDSLLLVTLIRAKHPRGLALLRDVLWHAPRPLACIAALQWIEGSGLAALEAELDAPPARSSARDLRRAGFGYGRFCGWPALDRMVQRRRPDDPLLQGAWLGAMSARSL